MKHLLSTALLAAGVSALPHATFIDKRQTTQCNTATTRKQWCNNLSIDTDYYTTVPDTGNTVTYDFEIGSFIAPSDLANGFAKPVMAFNGQIPGPLIEANWGDWIVVNVRNSVNQGAAPSLNGTSIHFHGIQQLNTFQEDGVPSITQCPLAPGDTITYRWRATQYGTSWYHSHFADQAWDGLFGPIILHGPASVDSYDEDLGTIILSDWDDQTADELQWRADRGAPPVLSTGLINGRNTYPGNPNQGKKFELKFEPNKTYRLRLINAAIDQTFQFAIDGHQFEVIQADLVPIRPYTTQNVVLTMGQRYDILVTTKSDANTDYWMRALPCTTITNGADITGIVRYTSGTGNPSTTSDSPVDTQRCRFDEPYEKLTPYLNKTAGVDANPDLVNVGLTQTTNQVGQTVFRWSLGSTTMVTEWENPSIEKAAANDFNFTAGEAVISVPNAGDWVYLAINSGRPNDPAHPIHLHGHDMYVLSQGTGAPPTITDAMRQNPVRRDVAILPPGGHLVLSFLADNPGAWLLHCHIGFHTFQGFGLQFVEQPGAMRALIDQNSMSSTCSKWDAWVQANGIRQAESGI